MSDKAETVANIAEFAKSLQNSEGFKQIMRSMKTETLKEWANTASSDEGKREELYRDIQAVGRFETRLQQIIDGAKIDQRKSDAAAGRPKKNELTW